MLKFVIAADAMKDAFGAVSALVEEVKIAVSENGLELKAVDPANVAMISLKIRSDAFEYFKADACELGIDLVRLNDVLSMADKGENITAELDEDSHKLKISVGSLSYTLSLVDPTAIRKEPRIPELDLPTHATIRPDVLRRAVKASAKVGDSVVVGMDDDCLYFEAKGDIDFLRLAVPITELLGVKPGTGRSLFSLDYLDDIAKAIIRANEVTLEIGIDYPMRIIADIGKATHVEYMVAPRIETE